MSNNDDNILFFIKLFETFNIIPSITNNTIINKCYNFYKIILNEQLKKYERLKEVYKLNFNGKYYIYDKIKEIQDKINNKDIIFFNTKKPLIFFDIINRINEFINNEYKESSFLLYKSLHYYFIDQIIELANFICNENNKNINIPLKIKKILTYLSPILKNKNIKISTTKIKKILVFDDKLNNIIKSYNIIENIIKWCIIYFLKIDETYYNKCYNIYDINILIDEIIINYLYLNFNSIKYFEEDINKYKTEILNYKQNENNLSKYSNFIIQNFYNDKQTQEENKKNIKFLYEMKNCGIDISIDSYEYNDLFFLGFVSRYDNLLKAIKILKDTISKYKL